MYSDIEWSLRWLTWQNVDNNATDAMDIDDPIYLNVTTTNNNGGFNGIIWYLFIMVGLTHVLNMLPENRYFKIFWNK